MKLAARKATARNAAVAGLAVVAVLGATGCSAINEQATTMIYSASDGIVANVGEAELRNLALVTSAPNAEARYIGTIAADSQEDLEVTLSVNGTDTQLTVPAGETLMLEDPANEEVIPDAGSFPGGMADVTVEVTGGGEPVTEQLEVSVLDGTLEEYRAFVPGGADPATVEHLYQTAEPEH